MTTPRRHIFTSLVLGVGMAVGMSSVFAQATDVAGAEALLQKNKCTKCHSVDKKK